jgi:hypothetical protein
LPAVKKQVGVLVLGYSVVLCASGGLCLCQRW